MPDPRLRRSRRPGRAPARGPALTVDPALLDLIGRAIADGPKDRPPLIAVAGAQGSGKTTLAREAARRFGAVHLSLDDVYLTRDDRHAVARDLHPLFETRGPPGTHDLDLLHRTIDTLTRAALGDTTRLPAFDKLADERRPVTGWFRFAGRPSAILIDGWCLGVTPQAEADLADPVNDLERTRDPDGKWRGFVNDFVAGAYAELFDRFDALIFLEAPDFDIVLDWRAGQEAGLRGIQLDELAPADHARLAEFIAHYERLTRHMIAGGLRPAARIKLDRNRRPLGLPR